MRNKLFLVLGLVCAFVFLADQEAFAAIYKYVDSDGLINFADDLQSVPPPYRSTAKIVGGEPDTGSMTNTSKSSQTKSPAADAAVKPPTVEAPAATPAPVPGAPAPSASREETESFRKRIITSIVVVVSAVFAFMILGILDTDYRKVVSIVRIVLLWGMTIYLIYAHAGDVLHLFSSMGSKIESVQKHSEEKGKKAAKAVKALNALMEQAEKAAPDSADEESDKKE